MTRRPIVLIHGYSDKGKSFRTWTEKLRELGRDPRAIHVCSYETLTNEVTIPDIAEGFDRALREKIGLDGDEEFDAIVHSTGMLVIRSWLTVYAKRRSRLKHLIGLAPASFGSPLAHKGRSWLGGIFKGRKQFGPDFLEAGDRVLDGLELGSRFTWELAEKDLLGERPYFGPNSDTPYVFTFCGTEAYSGIKRLISDPGTDGTVRWAGCSLNSRKIVLNLTKNKEETDRISFSPWSNVDIPFIPVEGADHGTILSDPSDELVRLVHEALGVESEREMAAWYADVSERSRGVLAALTQWQQFLVRVVDERGEPIPDYFLQLEGKRRDGGIEQLQVFDLEVHPYGGDTSFRNFHVNLSALDPGSLESLMLRVIASSGSSLVAYHGIADEACDDGQTAYDTDGTWNASLDLSGLLGDNDVNFFYPFTTTLVELRLNREPLPLSGPNKVCWFDDSD
ncbi:esterase/lipase family protein [Paenibacillus sp. GYB003]|uniref:esterase/lipase family protein n=1 Tax=Paenibacillus sp. GYB003 TaxID=2994392 RepID=UPI002F969F1F